ncbi:hypothetical protein V6N13_064944 [Hibiscus sabdariffa]
MLRSTMPILSTKPPVSWHLANCQSSKDLTGKRMCPEISLALQVLQLILANLLHWFTIETPTGETVDMREAPGITSVKTTPLEVHITPRLPTSVYDSTW